MQQNIGDARLFTYAWTDSKDEQHSLQFRLSTTQLRQMPPTGAAYNPQLAQQAVRMALLRYAKGIDPRQAKVDIQQQGAQLSLSVSSAVPGQAQAITEALAAQQKAAQQAYLDKHFYTHYTNYNRQKAIKHDHARYALESSQAMSVIVDAITQSLENPKDQREFINTALSWIQSIPYDTLEDRISSNGSGFASPRQLLLSNKGDCDSKSTLMAAIMKAYAPTVDVRMIFLPEHALLGIAMRKRPSDTSISLQNTEYVLLEPTGPAFYELGAIAPSSKNAIRNRQFTSELM